MKKITRKGRPLFKSSANSSPPSSAPAAGAGSERGGGGILRRTTWADKIRDKLPPLEENEYEVLWERGVLGVIFLESERDGIPYVSKATETCISPEVQPGDTLKFVNIVRSKDHSFSDFFKILATMKKPVLLRFERANAGTPTSDDDVAHGTFGERSNSSSSLGSTSSADSPRNSKYQRANSVPPNEQKPPKSGRSPFWRASSGRDSTIPKPQPATTSPVPRREASDGIFRLGREHDVSPQHTPNGSLRTPQETAAYHEYEVYWETGSLGLFFGEDRLTNLPVVTRSTPSANAVVQRMVAVNDTLVSANGIQSGDYTFDAFFLRLQQMNKPVRLVFRRPRQDTSPGKVPAGRKPSMTVDTNLSPGGMNLRNRQLSGGESPSPGRTSTPPLPPSPHVNVGMDAPLRRESERIRSPSPQSSHRSPTTLQQDPAAMAKLSTTTKTESKILRTRPGSTPVIQRISPDAAAVEARRNLSASMNGSMGSRSSVRVPKDDRIHEHPPARISERQGSSSRAVGDSNSRMSSKMGSQTSPVRSGSGSWSAAAPSPTIHTSLNDSPTSSSPPHIDKRPTPIETSDSYHDLFGVQSPAQNTSPNRLGGKSDITASPPKSPTAPSSPHDVWSASADDSPPVLPHSPILQPELASHVAPRVPLSPTPVEQLDQPVRAASDSDSDDDDIVARGAQDTFDSDRTDYVDPSAVAEDTSQMHIENHRASTEDIKLTDTDPISPRLLSEDAIESITASGVEDVEVGIVIDNDDEYRLRDEVDVSNEGADDAANKPDEVEFGNISATKHAATIVDSNDLDDDSDDEDDIGAIDTKSIELDDQSGMGAKVDDDGADDDAEVMAPIVADPDISSEIDVVVSASDVMHEASKIKDGVLNAPKSNKPSLNANLAKYKKKGKSARGITKLPALAESEALTVPLVAPNAVNTTVQVRGRPKPKLTMMDTPDGATYLVKWKENRSIGLQLKEVRFAKGTFPLVTDVCQEPCCESLKHICVGDVIVEINGKNTSSMGVKKTVNFLRSCSKTTLMKLRHGPAFASQRVSAYI